MTQNDKRILGKTQFLNLLEHLERRDLRRYAPMICLPNGENKVQISGVWMPYKTFQENYPPIPLLFKVRENPNKQGNFIKNSKSY